ncbi:MAG: RNA polymerase sigma factor [Planctomycetota bacterium]|nr:RNA polymerase sigma factor [Planctomycetota bacterium]
MNEDDAVLVQRILSGDDAGMRALVERYQQLVFSVCLRMLTHREDAEDVVQEVFVRVFRSLKSFDSSRPFRPWLMAIAANRCRTAIALRSRRPVPSDIAAELAVETRPSMDHDVAEEVQIALDKLRDDYKTCFILFYQQELNIAEIGEAMGCPDGTVKTWLHRARAQLAVHLTRRGLGPEVENELHKV